MSDCECSYCDGVRSNHAVCEVASLYERRLREIQKNHQIQMADLLDAVMDERRELGRYCLRIEQAAASVIAEVRAGFARPVTVRIRREAEPAIKPRKRKARR